MFQSISWVAFGTVIGLILLGYYLIAGLLLYSSEIKRFFKRRAPARGAGLKITHSVFPAEPLMGAVKAGPSPEPVPREANVDAAELVVSESTIAEEPENMVATGSLSDEQVLQGEVMTLIDALSTVSRDEVVALFGALFSRYAHLSDPVSRDRISRSVCEGCKSHGFPFEMAEVKSWWPSI